MYACCNFRRFLKLLAIDFAVIIFIGAVFLIFKALSGSSANVSDDSEISLPVIMYHSVYGNTPSEYVVTPQQLESDLEWLGSNGFTAVSPQELVRFTQGLDDLPDKPVLITFDDGHYNNLSEALPLLEKYDMQAVVSVVGSYTDLIAPKDPHESAYSYLTWNDISQLIASGRFTLGNHTYDMHSNKGTRKGCSKNENESEEEYRKTFQEDISTLQSEFNAETGYTPFVFAYPFGYISKESTPVLREEGFLITLTCYEKMNHISRDPDCLYGLDRYNRSGLYSTEEFMNKLLSDV